jgi:hypothetical protein
VRFQFVILSGEAVALGPDGSRTVLPSGTSFGGHEVVSGSLHAATVVARTAIEVVVLNGPAVRWAQAAGIARLVAETPSLPEVDSRPLLPLAS